MPEIATRQMPNGEMKRYPSKLAMAGSLNILGQSNTDSSAQLSDQNLKKVLDNMEKEKSLQFRQNTNNRGYGFQQTIANE